MKTGLSGRRIPSWLANYQSNSESQVLAVFDDVYEFKDDIWGMVHLNQFERDIVDSPEFQRLFRVSQMGFVDHVFFPANHTRGQHSVGSCGVSKMLCHLLETNTRRYYKKSQADIPSISFTSSVLISAAALLHDVTHLPLSHDLERRSHHVYLFDNPEPVRISSFRGPYPKHDDYQNNPSLYITLFDKRRSGLARVLGSYSPLFWTLLKLEVEANDRSELRDFYSLAQSKEWPNRENEILPRLLFHLLVAEKPTSFVGGKINIANQKFETVSWSLGPDNAADKFKRRLHESFYQPYRHDAVGNTISSDLLDYLARDTKRLGIEKSPDLYFLDYYMLGKDSSGLLRAVLNLDDRKRRTLKTGLINDLFRLLELRFEIHERAVLHRVVQACVAMLWHIMAADSITKPSLEEVLGWKDDLVALSGDDHFLNKLLHYAAKTDGENPQLGCWRLAQKVVERRVYKPIVMIPGDRIKNLLRSTDFNGPNPKLFLGVDEEERKEQHYRLLAALIDSNYYSVLLNHAACCIERLLKHTISGVTDLEHWAKDPSIRWKDVALSKRVIFWAPPYKQLVKDPEVWLQANKKVLRLQDINRNSDKELDDIEQVRFNCLSGLRYFEDRYRGLWSVYVFISDGLYYSGLIEKLSRLNRGNGPFESSSENPHLDRVRQATVLSMAAILSCWVHFSKNVLFGCQSARELRGWLEGHIQNSPGEAIQSQISCFWDCVAELNKETAKAMLTSISDVNVELYLHGDFGNDPILKTTSSCRDIRYRFAEEYGIEDAIKDHGLPDLDKTSIRYEFVKTLVGPGRLSIEEWRELSDAVKCFPEEEISSEILQQAARDVQRPLVGHFRTLWNKYL